MTALPLDGIRAIAIEQAVAAPLCSRHLADLGADVIKVERPDGGDFARSYDDYVFGYSSHFVWLNRGKRSVTLDFKTETGRQALHGLLATADVLVCNLAPGAFERVIADSRLEQRYPRLVRCYLSGYGRTGPYANRKAYDLLIQGEAGTIAATGTPDAPAKPGVSLADVAGGTYALAAINAALYARERTGLGRRIDIALFDTLLEWISPLLLAELHGVGAPAPAGLHHASIAPYGPFKTSDGGTVLVAVQNDGQWRRLCAAVLARPDLLEDERFATNALRVTHRGLTDSSVQQGIGRLSTMHAEELLQQADVPFGRLNQIADVVDHPQAQARERWSPVVLADGRPATVVTSPFHENSEQPPGHRVPRLGEHTAELLGDLY